METKTIALSVNENTARLYEAASPETRRKVQTLFEVLMGEMASTDAVPLNELMDAISDRAQARGLTPEILEELSYSKVSEEMINVEEFDNNEAGYLKWVADNPQGFVINAAKNGRYTKLHKATCYFISSDNWTNCTTNEYMKVCSLNKQELINWGRSFSNDFSMCQICDP
jgi:hypothetical protein